MNSTQPRHDSASGVEKPTLRATPLHALHRELGAKLVPFAGYEMPVQYSAGIVKEHLQVRSSAGLFDVSHMGQARLEGPSFEAIASALEALVPGDIASLKPGALRYTQLLNAEGGMIDDLMVSRSVDGGEIGIVVNASRKEIDFTHIRQFLPSGIVLIEEPDRALLALQGAKAAAVLSRQFPGIEGLGFLKSGTFRAGIIAAVVSRSGYTGEDGFEISVASADAEPLARRLLAAPEVMPIGLGARDSLRLEAGLCLYGQDMGEDTSPIEAGLAFSIGKRRRSEGGFPGADRIQRELATKPSRVRVGLIVEGRAAARTGTLISDTSGAIIGEVTSGAFTPSAGASIAMGYVPPSFSKVGTEVAVLVRGAAIPARIVAMPFVPHRYFRQA